MWHDPTGEVAFFLAPAIVKALAPVIVTVVAATVYYFAIMPAYDSSAGVSFGNIYSSSVPQSSIKSPVIETSVTSITLAQLQEGILGIGMGYGIGKCEAAAKAIADYLRRKNLDFQFAEIAFFEGERQYVVSDTGRFGPNENISTNAYHMGIEFRGRVYCNVHPRGLPTQAWFNDFQALGDKVTSLSSAPLGPQAMENLYLRYRIRF